MGFLTALVSAAAIAYPIVESIMHESNSKKAAALRKDLELVLNKYNLKLEQLRNELEKRGIRYNQLIDKLSTVSPVGAARFARDNAEKAYKQDVDTINSSINKVSKRMSDYSASENKKINEIESRGVIRTIFNN